jgi:1,4-dihydroxy-2-naphthoyl-CoA hydrolase
MSEDLGAFRERMRGSLADLFGLEMLEVERGRSVGRLDLRPDHMAPNDFLHAATVVALADSCCGIGSQMSLPEGGTGFTTIELKSNFLRSARPGDGLHCEATMTHGGRTTQVWDATVTRESDSRPIALFRCTQYVLR